jgi:hypothetical protein
LKFPIGNIYTTILPLNLSLHFKSGDNHGS